MKNDFFKKNILSYVIFVLIIAILIMVVIFYFKLSKLTKQLNSATNSSLNLSTLISSSSEISLAATTTPDIATSASSSLITSSTSLANPASKNCASVGGRLQIKKDGSGGEYGLCYFDDNRACEEWALLRGDCPWGGRKTTGFDTEAQRYCAWRGGETFAVENAVCKFKDGSSCLDEDLYNGLCSPGQNK